MPPTVAEDRLRTRNLRYMSRPSLWPVWPFLPLMRRKVGQEEEYGLVYDAFNVSGKTGYSSTVFVCNLFQVPNTEELLLALPHETFDRPEEIFDALLADRLSRLPPLRRTIHLPRQFPPESEVIALIELTRRWPAPTAPSCVGR